MSEIIQGMAEFERKLLELEILPRRRVLTVAAKAGAKIVLEEASVRAPRGKSGKLAAKMTMRVNSASDADEVSIDVGPDRQTFYGSFQERGTRYQTAQPFLVPSLETQLDKVRAVMRDILLRAIDQVAG